MWLTMIIFGAVSVALFVADLYALSALAGLQVVVRYCMEK